jgi:hypothetical protein
MRRIIQLSWLLGAFALSINAAAQAPAATPAPGDQGVANPPAASVGVSGTVTAAAPAEPAAPVAAAPAPEVAPPAPAASVESPDVAPPPPAAEAEKKPTDEGWQTVFTGYYRAPMILTLSSRRNPGDTTGSKHAQVVYGTSRLVDAGYASFPYTRLNEGDWAEIYLTQKRKHVAATVEIEGGLYSEAEFTPVHNSGLNLGQGWITLDTDFTLGEIKPHVELKMGMFWSKYGNIDKYDTYLFGRTHVMGEALKLDLPVNPDVTFQIVDGFGANRGGITLDNSGSAAFGSTLLHYLHLGVDYKNMLKFGLNYNDSWTTDPTLFTGAGAIGNYADARDGDMTVLGADVDVNASVGGHIWLALSYINVKNGWALSGTDEVMHSFGGSGIATNYLGYGSQGSTGSGSLIGLGFLYENSLSIVQGKSRGAILPDVTLNLFSMMASASRDLESGASIDKKVLGFKWGADVKVDTLSWLALMLRYDWVNPDMSNKDNKGHNFGVLTPRLILASHFLSNETLYLQYSRYFYGDKIGPNFDKNVVKMQATIGW